MLRFRLATTESVSSYSAGLERVPQPLEARPILPRLLGFEGDVPARVHGYARGRQEHCSAPRGTNHLARRRVGDVAWKQKPREAGAMGIQPDKQHYRKLPRTRLFLVTSIVRVAVTRRNCGHDGGPDVRDGHYSFGDRDSSYVSVTPPTTPAAPPGETVAFTAPITVPVVSPTTPPPGLGRAPFRQLSAILQCRQMKTRGTHTTPPRAYKAKSSPIVPTCDSLRRRRLSGIMRRKILPWRSRRNLIHFGQGRQRKASY